MRQAETSSAAFSSCARHDKTLGRNVLSPKLGNRRSWLATRRMPSDWRCGCGVAGSGRRAKRRGLHRRRGRAVDALGDTATLAAAPAATAVDYPANGRCCSALGRRLPRTCMGMRLHTARRDFEWRRLRLRASLRHGGLRAGHVVGHASPYGRRRRCASWPHHHPACCCGWLQVRRQRAGGGTTYSCPRRSIVERSTGASVVADRCRRHDGDRRSLV